MCQGWGGLFVGGYYGKRDKLQILDFLRSASLCFWENNNIIKLTTIFHDLKMFKTQMEPGATSEWFHRRVLNILTQIVIAWIVASPCTRRRFKVSSRVKNHNFLKFAIFKWLNRANQELSFKKKFQEKMFFLCRLMEHKSFFYANYFNWSLTSPVILDTHVTVEPG